MASKTRVHRKKLAVLAACALTPLAAVVRKVRAQSGGGFPAKPIRLVVGFAAGGGVDINARLLAAKLTELLGVAVLVENKPGAGSNIANEFVANAPPDGHTLLFNNASVVVNTLLHKKQSFDALRDFAPVSVFAQSQNVVVVNASKPIRNVGEFINLAKGKAGALSYASAGNGSTIHLSTELFRLKAQIDLLHVPYSGSAPALTALLAGEVDLGCMSVPVILPHIRSGRLRPLAVLGPRRAAQLPDVPTLKEAGVEGVEAVLWYGVLAPAGTPAEIVNLLSSAIAKAVRLDDTRGKLTNLGADPVGSTPEAFALFLKSEFVRWAAVIKAVAIQLD